MDAYITIKEMMDYYNTGKGFSMVWVTSDVTKGTGGAIKEVALATKHYQGNRNTKTVSNPTPSLRNPNHFSNSTINIRIPGNGQTIIRTVHVQLIRRFNGAIVK